jgi:hypothetical protein
VRRDGDPTKTLEVLRASSRRNLAENIGWTAVRRKETSGSAPKP